MPFSFTYDFLNTARVSITTKRHAAPPGTTVVVLPHSEAEEEESIKSLTALEKLMHMLSAKEEDLTLVS